MKVLVSQSCPTLCDPTDCSPPGSSVHVHVQQARILEWVAIPFSKGSSQSRNQTQVSCMAVRSFTVWATREAPSYREYIGCLSQGVEGEWNGWRGQKVQTLSYKKNKSRGWEPGITSHTRVSEPERGRGGTSERHLPQEASGTPPGPKETCDPAWRNHCAGADAVPGPRDEPSSGRSWVQPAAALWPNSTHHPVERMSGRSPSVNWHFPQKLKVQARNDCVLW